MASTGHRTEKFNFDLALDIIFAQICRADLHLVPIETISSWSLDFRLIDRCVLTKSDLPIHDEEAEISFWQGSHRVELHDLLISGCFLLFCGNRDTASFSHAQ